jgi:hypothetical protein
MHMLFTNDDYAIQIDSSLDRLLAHGARFREILQIQPLRLSSLIRVSSILSQVFTSAAYNVLAHQALSAFRLTYLRELSAGIGNTCNQFNSSTFFFL